MEWCIVGFGVWVFGYLVGFHLGAVHLRSKAVEALETEVGLWEWSAWEVHKASLQNAANIVKDINVYS